MQRRNREASSRGVLPVARPHAPAGDVDAARVLDELPVGVVLVDAAGDEVWSNRAAAGVAATDAARANVIRAITDGLTLHDPPAEAATPPRAGAAVTAGTSDAVLAMVVALPTDGGVVDREVRVRRVGDLHAVVFPVDPTPGTGAGHAGASIVASVVSDTPLFDRLEAMLEHTTDIITVLDAEGRVRFSNAAAGRVTGMSGAEVNGRHVLDLIHPEDVPAVAGHLAAVLERPGAIVTTDLRIRFADGEWHQVEVYAENLVDVPTVDGIVATLHDVTDRVRTEERVAEREARLRSLLENLTDVVVVLDERYEVTFVSPGIEHIIEAPPDSNLGMSAFNDIHPDDLPIVVEALDSVKAGPLGETRRVEVRLESRPGTGRWRWLEATAVNRLADPGVAGIVVTLHDVTERKEAARGLQAALDRERATAERLRELDRMKDDFLATVSHELRTPLAAVVGFAELLRRGGLDEAVSREVLTRLSASASSMRAMVDNVLDFSALEAGQVTLQRDPVDLNDAIATALRSLGESVTRHVVDVRVAPGAAVIGDQDGVGHVLRNLISNAAKYSPEGSTITVEAARMSEPTVRIAVEDHGIGIPPEQRDRVFERFYRAPGATFVGRGSGIGLNIVRRYTELMGGTVAVSSELGRGSRFEVTLPAATLPA